MGLVVKRIEAGHYRAFIDGWDVGDFGTGHAMEQDISGWVFMTALEGGLSSFHKRTKGEIVAILRDAARDRSVRESVAYEKERWGHMSGSRQSWLKNWGT